MHWPSLGLRTVAVALLLPTAAAQAASGATIPLERWLKCSMDDGSSWRAKLSQSRGVFDDGQKTWSAGPPSDTRYELNAEHTHVLANPQYKYQIIVIADDALRISISSLKPLHSAKGVCEPESQDD